MPQQFTRGYSVKQNGCESIIEKIWHLLLTTHMSSIVNLKKWCSWNLVFRSCSTITAYLHFTTRWQILHCWKFFLFVHFLLWLGSFNKLRSKHMLTGSFECNIRFSTIRIKLKCGLLISGFSLSRIIIALIPELYIHKTQ